MADKETVTITNPKAHKLSPVAKTITMIVEVKLDLVPGFGYEPEDHINFTFQNPYVQSITINKDLVIDPI